VTLRLGHRTVKRPDGQTTDAQAAYEALMTLLPTFLAGTNWVMHAAGWLEGGLVSCYEKFIVDVELLRDFVTRRRAELGDEGPAPQAARRPVTGWR
jgi:trimethylamine:corrinoid methyltransferase-like protein